MCGRDVQRGVALRAAVVHEHGVHVNDAGLANARNGIHRSVRMLVLPVQRANGVGCRSGQYDETQIIHEPITFPRQFMHKYEHTRTTQHVDRPILAAG